MSTNADASASQPDPNTANPATRHPRITPRNSDGDGDTTSATKETPWRTLNQLASMPKPSTPQRRASSAGPSSSRRSARRTPGTGHRIGSGRRAIAVTPHGRAAQREIELRRAGLTPGKDRRRSGRQQRETPRDILRQLSRHLAPKTETTVPTPTQGPDRTRTRFRDIDQDDLDDGPDLPRPRLSLALDEDDEDDSLLLPPRSAGLEDEENITVRSVELGRRAISEQPPGRYSRGSFGSVRMSDVFADLNAGPIAVGEAYDSSYVMGGAPDDDAFQADNTVTLHDFGLDDGRFFLTQGRDSDIRPLDLPGDDTENTFLFNIPPREESDEVQQEETMQSQAFAQDEHDQPLILEEDLNMDDEPLVDEQDRLDNDVADGTLATDYDLSIQDTTIQDPDITSAVRAKNTRKKQGKLSKHGIEYPSLPAGVVKKLATTFARTAGSKAKISKETLDAIMLASDYFFEYVSDDLAAYAEHAGRKTIDESDIVTLMARQRQTNATTTPFSLAQKYLPRELLQELRMVPPSKPKKGRKSRLEDIAEEIEE